VTSEGMRRVRTRYSRKQFWKTNEQKYSFGLIAKEEVGCQPTSTFRTMPIKSIYGEKELSDQ